jgi:cell division septation protein DedD
VSQSHEPSYYEIALTNRQVLIVFVVLLICVVAAFFSGVWVGQRDAPAAVVDLAQEGATEPAAESEEGSEVKELHFFADEDAAQGDSPSLAEMADEPQPETTLLEDLGGREAEPEAAVAASEPPASSPAPTQTAPDSAASQATAASGYVIQVFSSADAVQARKLLGQLTDGGYPAFLSPVEVGSQTMMRVRIGPYSQLANAETVAERIRREFRLDTWVTR